MSKAIIFTSASVDSSQRMEGAVGGRNGGWIRRRWGRGKNGGWRDESMLGGGMRVCWVEGRKVRWME